MMSEKEVSVSTKYYLPTHRLVCSITNTYIISAQLIKTNIFTVFAVNL